MTDSKMTEPTNQTKAPELGIEASLLLRYFRYSVTVAGVANVWLALNHIMDCH